MKTHERESERETQRARRGREGGRERERDREPLPDVEGHRSSRNEPVCLLEKALNPS